MDDETVDLDPNLTSTVCDSELSTKNEKTDANDSTPTSSTDAASIFPGTSSIEDPISSTSSDVMEKEKLLPNINSGKSDKETISKGLLGTDGDVDLLDINIANVSSAVITEDVEDIVQDLENLLGEPEPQHDFPTRRKERTPSKDEELPISSENPLIENTESSKHPSSSENTESQEEVEIETYTSGNSPTNFSSVQYETELQDVSNCGDTDELSKTDQIEEDVCPSDKPEISDSALLHSKISEEEHKETEIAAVTSTEFIIASDESSDVQCSVEDEVVQVKDVQISQESSKIDGDLTHTEEISQSHSESFILQNNENCEISEASEEITDINISTETHKEVNEVSETTTSVDLIEDTNDELKDAIPQTESLSLNADDVDQFCPNAQISEIEVSVDPHKAISENVTSSLGATSQLNANTEETPLCDADKNLEDTDEDVKESSPTENKPCGDVEMEDQDEIQEVLLPSHETHAVEENVEVNKDCDEQSTVTKSPAKEETCDVEIEEKGEIQEDILPSSQESPVVEENSKDFGSGDSSERNRGGDQPTVTKIATEEGFCGDVVMEDNSIVQEEILASLGDSPADTPDIELKSEDSGHTDVSETNKDEEVASTVTKTYGGDGNVDEIIEEHIDTAVQQLVVDEIVENVCTNEGETRNPIISEVDKEEHLVTPVLHGTEEASNEIAESIEEDKSEEPCEVIEENLYPENSESSPVEQKEQNLTEEAISDHSKVEELQTTAINNIETSAEENVIIAEEIVSEEVCIDYNPLSEAVDQDQNKQSTDNEEINFVPEKNERVIQHTLTEIKLTQQVLETQLNLIDPDESQDISALDEVKQPNLSAAEENQPNLGGECIHQDSVDLEEELPTSIQVSDILEASSCMKVEDEALSKKTVEQNLDVTQEVSETKEEMQQEMECENEKTGSSEETMINLNEESAIPVNEEICVKKVIIYEHDCKSHSSSKKNISSKKSLDMPDIAMEVAEEKCEHLSDHPSSLEQLPDVVIQSPSDNPPSEMAAPTNDIPIQEPDEKTDLAVSSPPVLVQPEKLLSQKCSEDLSNLDEPQQIEESQKTGEIPFGELTQKSVDIATPDQSKLTETDVNSPKADQRQTEESEDLIEQTTDRIDEVSVESPVTIQFKDFSVQQIVESSSEIIQLEPDQLPETEGSQGKIESLDLMTKVAEEPSVCKQLSVEEHTACSDKVIESVEVDQLQDMDKSQSTYENPSDGLIPVLENSVSAMSEQLLNEEVIACSQETIQLTKDSLDCQHPVKIDSPNLANVTTEIPSDEIIQSSVDIAVSVKSQGSSDQENEVFTVENIPYEDSSTPDQTGKTEEPQNLLEIAAEVPSDEITEHLVDASEDNSNQDNVVCIDENIQATKDSSETNQQDKIDEHQDITSVATTSDETKLSAVLIQSKDPSDQQNQACVDNNLSTIHSSDTHQLKEIVESQVLTDAPTTSDVQSSVIKSADLSNQENEVCSIKQLKLSKNSSDPEEIHESKNTACEIPSKELVLLSVEAACSISSVGSSEQKNEACSDEQKLNEPAENLPHSTLHPVGRKEPPEETEEVIQEIVELDDDDDDEIENINQKQEVSSSNQHHIETVVRLAESDYPSSTLVEPTQTKAKDMEDQTSAAVQSILDNMLTEERQLEEVVEKEEPTVVHSSYSSYETQKAVQEIQSMNQTEVDISPVVIECISSTEKSLAPVQTSFIEKDKNEIVVSEITDCNDVIPEEKIVPKVDYVEPISDEIEPIEVITSSYTTNDNTVTQSSNDNQDDVEDQGQSSSRKSHENEPVVIPSIDLSEESSSDEEAKQIVSSSSNVENQDVKIVVKTPTKVEKELLKSEQKKFCQTRHSSRISEKGKQQYLKEDLEQPLSVSIDEIEKEKPYSPKITIKPIREEEPNEDKEEHKGSLKITITKQSDNTHSILKMCSPDLEHRIKQSENDDQNIVPKLVIKTAETHSDQHSPKMSTRSSKQILPGNSNARSCSPRITIKPIVKETSPLKITIKPIGKPEEFSRQQQKHSPKQVKNDDHYGTRSKIMKLTENSDVHNSPKVTIKPVKPPEENETAITPKITIKPIEKPEEARTSPKITIKPVVRPTEDPEVDDEVKKRIVLKINKGTIPMKDTEKLGRESRKRELEDDKSEKLAKIKLKFSKDGDAHIVHKKDSDLQNLNKRQPDSETEKSAKRIKLDTTDSDDDVKLIEDTQSPIVISEDSQSQDSVILIDNVKEAVIETVVVPEPKPQLTPVVTAPRKRGRPRKVPLVVREEFGTEQKDKVDAVVHDPPPVSTPESETEGRGRPKRSCRAQSVRDTLGIKPRKPSKPRGGKRGRGASSTLTKNPKEAAFSEAKAGLLKSLLTEEAMQNAHGSGILTISSVNTSKEEEKKEEPIKPFGLKSLLEAAKDQNIIEVIEIDTPSNSPKSNELPEVEKTEEICIVEEESLGTIDQQDKDIVQTDTVVEIKEFEVQNDVLDLREDADCVKESSEFGGTDAAASDVEMQPPTPVFAPPLNETSAIDINNTTDIAMFEEETRMSADVSSRAQTPAKQVVSDVMVEESQSSIQSTATTESGKISRRSRLEVHQDQDTVFTADQLNEYYWSGNGPFMIQEQVAQFLGIKSFKRKYPGIPRRMVDMQERDYIRENGLASESMCDLGLTAVNSADILDIMYTDFQEKYEEFCRIQRDKQAKDLLNKQKALSTASNQEKSKLDILQQAVQSAATYNANFNKTRREQRRACMDLQTMNIHYPRGKMKKISVPKTGHYPVAVVPGQFTDYYKEFTPTELNNLPFNTMLYTEIYKILPEVSDSDSDSSGSDSDDSSSSDSESNSSCEENCKMCEKRSITPRKSPVNSSI